jgi:aldose sugar dehydrogenase
VKYRAGYLPLVVLLALRPAFAGSPEPDTPTVCPPTHTVTTDAPDAAGLVLAASPEAIPVRIGGPFESPWAMAFLPDGSLFVTERPGRLQHVRPGVDETEVTGLPVVLYSGHGGLLDVALDPNFAANGLVYLSYLHGEEDSSTIRVLRAKFDAANETLTDQQILFESGPPAPKPEMIGGRLALTGDGYLFLTLGDRWERDPAQDLSDDSGKIIRIRTDGSVPEDNPFVSTPGARPEIWSYGHRNPQGIAIDPSTGKLWSDEHGPQGGDEVNLILPGHNYGWPLANYGVDYSGRPIGLATTLPGMDGPIHYWVPISIAPSSLALQTDANNTVLWIGALSGEMVVRLTLAGDCVISEQHLVAHQLGRIRDVAVGPGGDVYLLTDGSDGALYRLDPTPGAGDEQSHL